MRTSNDRRSNVDVTLRPEGPHSIAYTEQTAEAFAEVVRVLNYATGIDHGRDGLPYPSTVCSLLGYLRTGTGGMDQLLRQVGDAVARQQVDGVLSCHAGEFDGRPDAAAAATVAALDRARAAAKELCKALGDARNATAWLAYREVE
jgi:hypothetical protein